MHRADIEFDRGNFAAASEGYRSILAGDPENIAALQKLGGALKGLGQFQEAALILTRSLKFDPGSAYTHYFLGEVAEAQGHIDKACASWRTVVDLAQDFEPAWLGLCRSLHQLGQLDTALRAALDGIQHNPQSADLLFCLGNLHYLQQQFDMAEQAYRHAIELQPDRADILASLGSAIAAQNRFEAAIEIMQRATALDPNRAEVQSNLADALFKAGRFDEAFASLGRAVALARSYANVWIDWGLVLHQLNRYEEAIECFRQFLRENPTHIPTLFNLANVLHATRQWDDAAKNYSRILDLTPDRIDVLCHLAINSQASGDDVGAAACYRRALALQPEHADANFNLGALLHARGKLQEAVAHYITALAGQPDLIRWRLNLAHAYRTLGKWTESASECEHVLRIEPNHVDALLGFGMALQAQGRYEEAIAPYRNALAIDPANHDVLINLGTAFEAKVQFDAALECYEKALQADARSVAAHVNMAALFTLQGRLDESVALCDQALEIDPNHPDAHYSRGLSLLRLGEYVAGWQEYEYRWTRTGAPPKPEFPGVPWLGEQNLRGKTIFLYTEQGLGDTLQFVRYVEPVAAMGARIILEVQAPLLPLLKNMKGVDHFVVRDQKGTLPAYDFLCSLLSLPAAFKSDLASIPVRCPYVLAPPHRMAYWMEHLADKHSPKIGLVWAGNPLHKNDSTRSTSLSILAPLWSRGNRSFLSLQKDVPTRDAALLKEAAAIVDLSPYLTDFAETAAIISCLDLVITVDSSMAHLAGALGVPVWIMLPWLPDFRWMMERQDSPWYPSARLFRQSSPGDWASVVNAIDQALAERFGAIGMASA
jgi:tetratricopeptide (TPR) repeat protein